MKPKYLKFFKTLKTQENRCFKEKIETLLKSNSKYQILNLNSYFCDSNKMTINEHDNDYQF